MSALDTRLLVARWEFRRFFRPRDMVVTLLLFVLGALAWAGIRAWLLDGGPMPRVAVIHAERLGLGAIKDAPVEILLPGAGEDRSSLKARLVGNELDGLLELDDADSGRLLVTREALWQQELQMMLDAARQRVRIRDAGLSAETVRDLTAGFRLEVRRDEAGARATSPAEKVAAGILVSLMLIGVLVGNSYLFVGITGEKQQRVTEQIVAIVSPQAWIDGKILGSAAMALVSVVNLGFGIVLSGALLRLLGGGFAVPLSLVRPGLVAEILLLTLLGFAFWFCFFAAVAATIDDPNTSARSSLLMLPLLPLGFAFAALKAPDALLVQILGILPLTSPSVLPARLVLTRVPAWEVLLAVVLLIGSIALLRRAAGKIFSLGVLTYGKEPTWGEMMRTLRKA